LLAQVDVVDEPAAPAGHTSGDGAQAIHDALPGVYEWLVTEPMLTPEGSVEAF